MRGKRVATLIASPTLPTDRATLSWAKRRETARNRQPENAVPHGANPGETGCNGMQRQQKRHETEQGGRGSPERLDGTDHMIREGGVEGDRPLSGAWGEERIEELCMVGKDVYGG